MKGAVMLHPSPKVRTAFFLLLLMLPALFAYIPSMRGVFVLDDCEIYANPNIRLEKISWDGLVRATGGWHVGNRPLVYLSFALNYYFGRLNPFGYHLVNLFIHLAAGVVVFFLFRVTLRLARSDLEPGSGDDLAALAAAALWLSHPLNIQAVTYTVQRMASMAALFYLAAMLAYAHGRLRKGRRPFLLGLAGLFAVMAMMCKENAATLPLALFLYEWIFLQKGRMEWLRRSLPWLAAGVGALVLLAFVYTGFHPVEYILSGYVHRPFTLTERLLTEARILVFYLSLFLWPAPSRFSLEHDFSLSRSLVSPPSTILAVLFLAAALFAALRGRRRNPVASFAVLWFLLTHMVESSVVALVLVFEHRNYLPLVFVCLAAVERAGALLPRRTLLAATAVAVSLLAVLTFQRNQVWGDRVRLLEDAAVKAPGNSRVHVNLAQALMLAGADPAKARKHCLAALKLNPRESSALNDLGIIAYGEGDMAAALAYFKKAVAIEPRSARFRMQLAKTLLRLERYQEAEAEFRRILTLEPGNREAAVGLRYIAALRRMREGRAPAH